MDALWRNYYFVSDNMYKMNYSCILKPMLTLSSLYKLFSFLISLLVHLSLSFLSLHPVELSHNYMAGTLVKRHRDEFEESDIQEFDENREAKRYKPYNTTINSNKQQALVSFLEQQEDDHDIGVSSQDLSLFLTNLQQELFSDPSPCLPDPSNGAHQTLMMDPTTEAWNICSKEDDDEKESVIIRHLLEASDDELGLPNEVGVDRTVSSGDEDFNGVDDDDEFKHNSSLFCDGILWELEDEAANYYTLLQSQLFM